MIVSINNRVRVRVRVFFKVKKAELGKESGFKESSQSTSRYVHLLPLYHAKHEMMSPTSLLDFSALWTLIACRLLRITTILLS